MSAPKLLLVDDEPRNIRLLEAVLEPRGYDLISAASGLEALDKVATERPDLVLLDILMPDLDGHEVCRRLRANPANQILPVVMITASGDQQRVRALESGADDFIQKPFDTGEVLARIKSLLRIKGFHDIIQQQAAELAVLNRDLEQRVQEQVAELARLGRLRRFLSPRLAELLVSAEGEALLEKHRRQIAVVSCQLRGFAELAETAEPEEVLDVLHDYHAMVGKLTTPTEASVGQLSADEIVLFFNDPLPVDQPALDAVRLAIALREAVAEQAREWQRRGFALRFAAGVDFGYATLGSVGFEARSEYAAVGPVVYTAVRLREAAPPGQILIGNRAHLAVENDVETRPIGDLPAANGRRSITAFEVVGWRADKAALPAMQEPGGVLTAREREVAALIARGYTNRQIAEALVVAEPTAVRHVANILNKLDLSSRARVAVWAVEHGLG